MAVHETRDDRFSGGVERDIGRTPGIRAPVVALGSDKDQSPFLRANGGLVNAPDFPLLLPAPRRRPERRGQAGDVADFQRRGGPRWLWHPSSIGRPLVLRSELLRPRHPVSPLFSLRVR